MKGSLQVSSILRSFKRANMPKRYKHCGKPMIYVEGKDVYICQECGKEKKPREKSNRRYIQPRNPQDYAMGAEK